MALESIPNALALAFQHHQAQRLQDAELIYRQIIASNPGHAEAIHLLGVLCLQTGRNPVACELLKRATLLQPLNAQAFYHLGMALTGVGQTNEAIAAYHKAIALDPAHVDALVNLGAVLKQTGLVTQAISAWRSAILIRPANVEAYSNLGVALTDIGQFEDAIVACRRAIELGDYSAIGHFNLANAFAAKQQWDHAIESYQSALSVDPLYAEALCNLGAAFRKYGQLDNAISAWRRCLEMSPRYVEAWNNLGVGFRETGRLDNAIACFEKSLELSPNSPEVYNNLGLTFLDSARLPEAIAALGNAVRLNPSLSKAHGNLGNVFKAAGQLDDAIVSYRNALAIDPNSAEANYNLGAALSDQGNLEESVIAYERAILLRPTDARAYSNLGNLRREIGQIDAAMEACRQAIALDPSLPEAHNNLGTVLLIAGSVDSAIDSFSRAVYLRPDYSQARSNLIYAMLFSADVTPQQLSSELQKYNQQHAALFQSDTQAHHNVPDPNRQLRIGYVSPDFRDHVVGRNLLPLFRHHDHSRYEIFCYSNSSRHDEFTRIFQDNSDGWHYIGSRSDDQVSTQIRDDRIDILVDLSLHLANNRLPVFAHKPAPLQVTFAGYPGSTGLTTIDYRLTDPYLDPTGDCQTDYSEQSLRLPHSFWCYDPIEGRYLPVSSLPALRQQTITFGCLNNFCKLNSRTIAAWSKILTRVEGSRLLLLAYPGNHRDRSSKQFLQHGVSTDRIEFCAPRSRGKYLELYHHIDIGLDTFPYNGHTTSLDSFWMGVPVVSLVGNSPVSRAGLSQASQLGLKKELTSDTEPQFVQIAVELANDLQRLSMLRTTLRERMAGSALMNESQFAADIEATYRSIWRTWCDRRHVDNYQGLR